MRDLARAAAEPGRRPAASAARASAPAHQNAQRTGWEAAPARVSGDIWRAATTAGAGPLPHRETMERLFGRSFAGVRAYLGRGQALDALGAKAATDGERVAFASHSPSRRQVAHELAHVAQMDGKADGARLSEPGSPAEREAHRVAERAGAGQPVSVAEAAPAALHRDMKADNLDVPHGTFKIDMTKTEVAGDWSGEDGYISYMPKLSAPDSASIRLSQVVENKDLETGKEFDWKTKDPSQKALGEMQTAAGDRIHITVAGDTLDSVSTKHFGSKAEAGKIGEDNKASIRPVAPGALANTAKPLPAGLKLEICDAVKVGYFVDHFANDPAAKKRSAAGDPLVPQDYVWPGEEKEKENQHGSKKGKERVAAIIKDFPSTKRSHQIKDFETVARSDDIGLYYGTLWWRFEVDATKTNKDGTRAKPKVTNEAFGVRPGVSDTFRSAVAEFNRFYANPHVVMKGQTLYEISRLYFGVPDRAKEIFTENAKLIGKIDSPLKPGWSLRIPDVTGELAKKKK